MSSDDSVLYKHNSTLKYETINGKLSITQSRKKKKVKKGVHSINRMQSRNYRKI